MKNIGPAQTICARETVDFHFGDRGAVREVMKRPAPRRFEIKMNVRGPIETLGEKRHALLVCNLTQRAEGDRLAGRRGDHAVVKTDSRRVAVECGRGNRGEARSDLRT